MRPAAGGGGLGASLGSSIGVHLGFLAAAIGVAYAAAPPGLGSSDRDTPTVTWEATTPAERVFEEERELILEPREEAFRLPEPRLEAVDDRADRLAAALAAIPAERPAFEPLPDFESALLEAAGAFGPRVGSISEATTPEELPEPAEATLESASDTPPMESDPAPSEPTDPATTPNSSGATQGARLIDSPAPAYPRIAQRMGIQGTVLLRLHVNARGLVIRTELLRSSGSERLDEAALEGVASWRFEPAQENGLPVEGTYDHEVEFRLR